MFALESLILLGAHNALPVFPSPFFMLLTTSVSRRRKPQWVITYWCPRCRLDSGRTEMDGPYCYCCTRTDGLVEIEREPMSPAAISHRLKIASDRMMERLRQAHGISQEDWLKDECEESILLEALAKGKDLQDELRKIAKRMKSTS